MIVAGVIAGTGTGAGAGTVAGRAFLCLRGREGVFVLCAVSLANSDDAASVFLERVFMNTCVDCCSAVAWSCAARLVVTPVAGVAGTTGTVLAAGRRCESASPMRSVVT